MENLYASSRLRARARAQEDALAIAWLALSIAPLIGAAAAWLL